jgi:hypothetical protein
MARGQYKGRDVNDPDFRALFTRESVTTSDWYVRRLSAKQRQETQLWRRHIGYLENFLKKKNYAEEAGRLRVAARLEKARATLDTVQSPAYLESLKGTIGLQPLGE